MRPIATLCALAITVSASAAIPTSEREALVALYQSTNGNAWTDKTNWLGAAGTECTWYGVTCDEAQAHVEQLDALSEQSRRHAAVRSAQAHRAPFAQLWDNNLRGALPSQISELSQLEGSSCASQSPHRNAPGGRGAR